MNNKIFIFEYLFYKVCCRGVIKLQFFYIISCIMSLYIVLEKIWIIYIFLKWLLYKKMFFFVVGLWIFFLFLYMYLLLGLLYVFILQMTIMFGLFIRFCFYDIDIDFEIEEIVGFL